MPARCGVVRASLRASVSTGFALGSESEPSQHRVRTQFLTPKNGHKYSGDNPLHVERATVDQKVVGSSPTPGSREVAESLPPRTVAGHYIRRRLGNCRHEKAVVSRRWVLSIQLIADA